MWFIILSVLKYLFVAALVQVYVQLGPGGQVVQAFVDTIVLELLKIDWANLGSHVFEFIKTMLNEFGGYLSENPDLQAQVIETVEAAEKLEQGAQ